MAELDSETKELIEKLSGLIMAAVADKSIVFWEGCEVFSAPVGAAPEYLDVMVDGIRDQSVLWRGVPAAPVVTDLVLVWENPITHRREIIGGSGTAGTSGGVGPHNILSATHTDTVVAAVVRGDLMVGGAVGPAWTRLALGTRGYFIKSDGTDALWSLFAGDVYLIGSGGNCDYATIGAWIAGGHGTPATLFLQEDTFTEGALAIPANVRLKGQGSQSTIIDMQANTMTLNNGVSLENLTVTSTSANQTVDDNNTTGSAIRDCEIYNTGAAGNAYAIFTDGVLSVYNSIIDGYTAGVHGDAGTVCLRGCDVTGDIHGIRVNNATAVWTTRFCFFQGGSSFDVFLSSISTWDSYKDQFDPINTRLSGTCTMQDVNAGNSFAFTVKNTSGGTILPGEVGYIDSAGEFKDTTTAYLNAPWCVVVLGGPNNADMWVARRGRVTVYLNGNCSIGDFLYTSTTAGQAQPQSYFRDGAFAIALTANAAGAGGTCEALLLVDTPQVVETSANDFLALTGVTNSDFQATIAAAGVVADRVYYNAPITGVIANITPVSATELAKIVLHNTTRTEEAYIIATGADGVGNFIQVSAAADVAAWVAGNAITTRSQTNVANIGANYWYDIDISGSFRETVQEVLIMLSVLDSGGAGNYIGFHPFEASVASKSFYYRTQSTTFFRTDIHIGIREWRYCMLFAPSGGATMNIQLRMKGFSEKAA